MAREEAKEWVPVDRPWSHMEPISGPPEGPCNGSMGEFHVECKEPAKWRQFPTFGDSVMFFCDKHKKLQEGWDKILYDSQPNMHKGIPDDDYADVKKLFEKMDRKKRKKKDEPEEVDPTA